MSGLPQLTIGERSDSRSSGITSRRTVMRCLGTLGREHVGAHSGIKSIL